jgi:putative ABC transport system permease protein
MYILDIIKISGRNLKQTKSRTALTSLAIAVGAFTVTLALAAGSGGHNYANTLITSNGDANNLQVLSQNLRDKQTGPAEYKENQPASSQGSSSNFLSNNDIDKIKKIDGVSEIIPAYNLTAVYMTRGDGFKKYIPDISVKTDQTDVPVSAGKLAKSQVEIGTIVIPEDYLKALGFKTAKSAINQDLTVVVAQPSTNILSKPKTQSLTFKISAVSKKSRMAFNNQTALLVSIPDGKKIYDYETINQTITNGYFSLNVRVKDGYDITKVQNKIKKEGYTVFSLKDIQSTLFQVINIIQYGAAGFGALAILASIFGIINTQYISVLERTRQIGLMKALGASRLDIGLLFTYEAGWIGFLGGVIGTLLAVLTNFLNPIIAKALDLEKGTKLLIFNPLISLALIASLMLIAILAGYLPARKASKLDPIEALKTE